MQNEVPRYPGKTYWDYFLEDARAVRDGMKRGRRDLMELAKEIAESAQQARADAKQRKEGHSKAWASFKQTFAISIGPEEERKRETKKAIKKAARKARRAKVPALVVTAPTTGGLESLELPVGHQPGLLSPPVDKHRSHFCI